MVIMRSLRSRARWGVAALSLVAVAAACGGDDTEPAAADAEVAEPATTSNAATSTAAATIASAATAYPVTVTVGNGEVTLDARPEAIVSLSPTATEMLFAIGAGPQVVAVDALSNYPDDAPVTDLSGFEPNVEAIAGEQPDLVVTDGSAAGLTDSLEALDITVLELPAAVTFDDVYAQIEALGSATGHPEDASALIEQMQADIDTIVADLPPEAEGLTYYHELDDALYTVTSTTFIGQVYGLLGLENVADPADEGGGAGGYPQLSVEFLIAADPDLIFLADTVCCGQNAETVAARAGWDVMSAVQAGNVIPLDDDTASRWGPRVVDFLRAVADGVGQAVAA
jgi:iron complex transport system substrate-binding protein